MNQIYNPKYIQNLFDEMAPSYQIMNIITSFGLSEIWRIKTLKKINLKGPKTILDLFSGMGESLKYLEKFSNEKNSIFALDFSPKMIKNLQQKSHLIQNVNVTILEENFFFNKIKSNSFNTIVSCFGLKTLSEKQLNQLTSETNRLLKKNGEFIFTEISIPQNKIFAFFFKFYINTIVPFIGKYCLKNNTSYKMLGIYVNEFQNAKKVYNIFKNKNFEVEYISFFFGCVTGVKGYKI
ncbi:class I SAM-dependent methyltransferase [Aureivirga marina]|uniref:class I SAM-dependent methyltransferase n=1 Tax=Aureivirga marina TaxID=1182451 RepID=UPI0018C95CBA|nr:class I SAM-dependent methyltransferase [Aureivirga marina]